MSQQSGRSASTNVFNKKSKATCKSGPSPNRFTSDPKDLGHCCQTHGLHQRKQLKTRRERNQIRAASKVMSKIKSHRHHSFGHCSKDKAHFHNCCHCSSVRNAPFPGVAAAQEHCIITDSRLIGHYGLFSHEVKSVDIERLLSDQRKLEAAGQHVKEKAGAASLVPSTDLKASGPTDGLVAVDAHVLTRPADDGRHQKRKKSLHLSNDSSDTTTEQRPQRQLDLSSGSVRSLKNSSLSSATTTTKKSAGMLSEKGKKSQISPVIDRHKTTISSTKAKKHFISSPERTPDNPQVPAPRSQPREIHQSPIQLSSSITADNSDTKHTQDLKCLAKSLNIVAARLCNDLRFPFKRMKSLASESREVLWKCLQEKHGPWLQENLRELRKCSQLVKVSTKTVQHADHDFTVTEDDDLPSSDGFLKRTNQKSNPQFCQTPQQTAASLPFPVETSISGLEDLVKPIPSSQFYMDLELSKSWASHSFVTSSVSCLGEKASSSQRWHDALFGSKGNESLEFDCFEHGFIKQTNAVGEPSCGSRYCDTKMQPGFTKHNQRSDVYSMKEMLFPQHQDPFRSNAQHFAPSITDQNYHPRQNGHFSAFDKFTDHAHLTSSPHSKFPSSHLFERHSQTPRSSFPSPERWSFPAMRLY